jgi:hypothetical protein
MLVASTVSQTQRTAERSPPLLVLVNGTNGIVYDWSEHKLHIVPVCVGQRHTNATGVTVR